MQDLSRRQFLQFGLCAASMIALPSVSFARSNAKAKELSFYSLHTGEKLKVAYQVKGRYVPGALKELNRFMRDHRTGDVHPIDPQLFDQLYRLQHMVEAPGEFHVISAYRSPKTNRSLHEHSNGVASKSLHLQGCAMDIRLPGKDLRHLHKAALNMKAGGVGYYPGSDFIHLDTGKVRQWG